MKLNYPKEWFEQRIEKEGAVEIGAGIPEPNSESRQSRLSFGQFVALWRRHRGWNAERLAVAAGIGAEEVLEIEDDPHGEPEPEAVCKLAGVFGLPSRPLLELAGLVLNRSPRLRETPSRPAARSASVAPLSDAERQALEAIVVTLSEGKDRSCFDDDIVVACD